MKLFGTWAVYGSYKYMCDICGEKFRQKYNLDKHMWEVHSEKRKKSRNNP